MRPHGAGLGTGRLLIVLASMLVWAIAAIGADAEPAAATPPPGPKSVAELYREFAPAVVRVNMAMEELDKSGQPVRLVSTGFFITPEGRVLAGLGDSAKVSRVWIEKDGLEYAAEYLGGDVRTRLALVQVLKMPQHFAVVPVGDTATPLPIGTEVVALASPIEWDATPSPGWIAGFESSYGDRVFPCAYMRTTITLGLGEQGGPVLDREGNLVGIMIGNVVGISASYSVPAHSLKRIIRDLAENGSVDYGTLPIEFVESPDARYVARQVVIASVQTGSSAERAGLRPGDVLRHLALVSDRAAQLPPAITTPDETPIRRLTEVREVLFHALPGEFVRIEVERDGQTIPFFSLPVESLQLDGADAGNAGSAAAPAAGENNR